MLSLDYLNDFEYYTNSAWTDAISTVIGLYHIISFEWTNDDLIVC